ncbi:sensor histidine kinase [Sphingomonas sp. RS2018]
MSPLDDDLLPGFARTDGDGRLVEADPRLIDLVRRAGGEGIGAELPLPALAALERLARRLGIAVARSITVADGDEQIALDVRIEPAAGGATLAIGGWGFRPGWRLEGGRGDRDFLTAGADWTWEVDAALHITRLSSEAGERAGFDAAAMLGRPLVALFAFDDAADGFPILGAVAARQRFDRQAARVRASGRRVQLSARPQIDSRGRFAGFVGGAEMIDGVDAVPVDDVFADGFGERLDAALRTPLHRIIAHAGQMSAEVDGPLGENYTGYADDIASAGRHLLGLVDDLVDLEAVERPDFALRAEPIDLADVARRAAGLLAVRAGDRAVRIDRPALDEYLPASGDFRRALQVLVNLIGNAVRYSPGESMVWVRVESDGDRACVIVADQGRGIAPQDHELVFEKFGRVDAQEAGGSGLGLYISRRLARAMGGDLTLDSAPGQGARFVFTLPAR